MERNFMNIEFKDNIISGGEFFSNAVINNGNSQINSDFIQCLNSVIEGSDSLTEKNCALKAKELYNKENKKGLKSFVTDNIATFTTGTFATVCGGVLIEFIKQILKW